MVPLQDACGYGSPHSRSADNHQRQFPRQPVQVGLELLKLYVKRALEMAGMELAALADINYHERGGQVLYHL